MKQDPMQQSDTQRIIESATAKIILVGTAHISETSADEVEDALRTHTPDCVCIELDAHRFKNITGDTRWKNLNIQKILKRKEGMLLLFTLMLSSYQRRLANRFKVTPGVEIIRAINVAKALNIPIELSDRSIQKTLLRAWRSSRFFSKLKLLSVIFGSLFQSKTVSVDEIEQLKNKDLIQQLLQEMSDFMPNLKTVLIDERDRYLASKIFHASQKRKTVVAVIGAGHLAGVTKQIESYIKGKKVADLAALETVPSAGKVGAILKYLIPITVGALILFGFFRGGVERGLENILYWVLCNGILSAIGALVALAHPLTIVTSFIAAPITSLNPTIGVGFVAAFVQSFVVKPRVKDVEQLPFDTTSIKGFYQNRITRILLVFLLSSIGSAIGTFVALPLLLS